MSPDRALSRRSLMIGAARGGVAAVLAAGVTPPARAQDGPHRFKVGDAEVVVLSDGDMTLPPSLALPDRPVGDIEAAFAADGRSFGGGFKAEVNVAVVRIGAETILIDTGGGNDFVPTLGKLADRLAAAGIAPESVTRVIFTHAHPDHFWGVVDPLGGSAFEKARHTMSKAEFDFWSAPDVAARMPDNFKGLAAGTHRRLLPMADAIERSAPGTEVTPGVMLVDTAGHTPGHVSVLIRSGSQQLLIGGDALSQAVISFGHPDWRWGPDYDGERAAKSRRRLLDQLAGEQTPILGYHLPWPGVGRVERKDNAYRYVAL